ncbi:MAG: SurA N-terminal domain-containing protein [Candidatus Omnitrophota bacterium]
MLNLLRRKKVAKRIFYVLAFILIPAFMIWGSASVINKRKTPDSAGIIFGKKVSYDDFRDAFSGWRTQLKIQYGDKANEIASSFFNPLQATWDRLILLHEVKQRKINVTNQEVVSRIASLPYFARQGRFDQRLYEASLQYELNQPARLFEEHFRQNLAMGRLYDQVTQTIFASDEEIRKSYEDQNIKTRLEYVEFSPQTYKEKISVTDDELTAYFENHKEEFKIPPQINVAYVRVDFKDENAKKSIEEAYTLARRRGFKAAAESQKLEIQETGFFGFEDPIPAVGWLPQLSSLLFNLPPSAFSQIIELNDAAYIFKIKDTKPATIPEYKDVGSKVKEKVILEKAKALARQKAEDFLAKLKGQDARKAGPDFDKTAQENNLTVKETPLFAKEGYVAELGMAEALKDVAFGLDKNAVADAVVELPQGFYVVKSVETIPVDEEKFKEEKDEFAKQLVEEKRNKAFEEYFANLKKRANLVSYVTEASLK